jgi:SAM-dependent methyltransferase
VSQRTKPGPLLDFGCNFGQFLAAARESGWCPTGFEPNATAAEQARSKGFDVRCGWSLHEASFTEGYFAAITAIDVFYYVWLPIATIDDFYRLLRPGGVLAMRLTNKRLLMGFVRAFSSAGSRDERISRILQGQFHSISLTSLSRILHGVGFDRIQIQPHAVTAPWNSVGWQTRVAYLGAGMLYYLSFTKVNLSPGVLLFAQKKRN